MVSGGRAHLNVNSSSTHSGVCSKSTVINNGSAIFIESRAVIAAAALETDAVIYRAHVNLKYI